MGLIFTVQIALAERIVLNHNACYMDITVKSGDRIFAPTWEMVMGHKAKGITDAVYTDRYYAMMRASYRRHRARWDAVLAMEQVILACYCREDRFCHRHLLKAMLVKCGGQPMGEIRRLADLNHRGTSI